MAQKILITPASYYFKGIDVAHPLLEKARDWDWNLAQDIFEAVNAIRISKGKEKLSAFEISQEYKKCNPLEKSYSSSNMVLTVNNGKQVYWVSIPKMSDWFTYSIESGLYLPESIGTKLIDEITGKWINLRRTINFFVGMPH